MKSLKTMPKLLLAGGIAISSLAMVPIKKGETFAIQLPALPFYFNSPRWSLDSINHHVSFLKEDVKDPIPGSTGTRIYVFKANTSGITKIQFRKIAPMDNPTHKPEPVFWLTVKVRD